MTTGVLLAAEHADGELAHAGVVGRQRTEQRSTSSCTSFWLLKFPLRTVALVAEKRCHWRIAQSPHPHPRTTVAASEQIIGGAPRAR